MGKIQEAIEQTTGGYVLSVKIGNTVIDDTINGFLKPINKQVRKPGLLFKQALDSRQFMLQVESVCQQLIEDPALQDGYHAVGFSQVELLLNTVNFHFLIKFL